MNIWSRTTDVDLARHVKAFRPVSDCPLLPGNRVRLLPEAMDALHAMFAAIRGAERSILMEFYTLEDIKVDGQSLQALLLGRLAAGVRVSIIYDAVGSSDTPLRFFAALQRAGAEVMEFHGFDPLRRFFSLRFNDRDHRKILVVDERVAFIGGVNIDRQYLNPRSAGVPRNGDATKAFWQDAAVELHGPVVPQAAALFHHTWARHRGDKLPPQSVPSAPELPDGELVCIEGSAPREGRPLHIRAFAAAADAARSRIWLASGYFVPMPAEIRALRRAARRGVEVRLVLPGVSDVPACVHAARGTYGRLLRRGVQVHELTEAILHAKVATIDGVWTSVGSSNLDRRSAVLNNEVDAVVLGRPTAQAVETMMGGWFASGQNVDYAAWADRSVHEHIGELTALLWKRMM